MFLSYSDLDNYIQPQYLTVLAGTDTIVVTNALLDAEDEIRTYLANRFDVAKIFDDIEGQPTKRRRKLVKVGCYLAISQLYSRIQQDKIPSYIAQNEKDSRRWLELCAAGTIGGFPLRPIDNHRDAAVMPMASNPKQFNYF